MNDLIGLKKGDYYICKRAAMRPAMSLEAAKDLISKEDFPGNWVVVKVKAVPNSPLAQVKWDE